MKTTKVILPTGVTVTRKVKKGIERIEVDSKEFELDPMYQQVTLDTEYEMWQKGSLTNLLKSMK